MGLIICYSDSQNSGKCYAYNYSSIRRDTNERKQVRSTRSERVLSAEVFILMPGTPLCQYSSMFTNQETLNLIFRVFIEVSQNKLD